MRNIYIYMIIWRFPKMGYPKIIYFNGFFHYKPTILGYPHFIEAAIYIYIIYIYNISYHEYDDKHRVKRLNSQCMLSEANYSN